ncbi:UDP-N-acetylglucosamine 2-epimerase [Psychroserpens algicola]|uniref:UDP-N-acetylglucosamine 2-epimerase n=1 Tax=Psychroserpens algicola TaxID=1719034 RepID=A0ABT0H850_9FLAO|nr:UDP-N-acetylglucosamine 2-epimerase [Psychroserpens algicola]MCK8480541.1 UDP-N-acetylglucosamine 2-epimerase [Psychroserpens algicola]
MKIGVLTSSRADYGIYLPLLQQLKTDDFFQLEIIAFGTHLSKTHGYTLTAIENDAFEVIHNIESLEADDSTKGITKSYGNTVLKFADFWQNHSFDLVFCLGDRFEMSAAVQASIPFGVKLAHIHGGETTLGAIDNIYRHQITLASQLHFVSTADYKKKVAALTGTSENIYNVGALSLDNINNFQPIEKSKFLKTFRLKDAPYALVTFHPETVAVHSNKTYALHMKSALAELSNTIHIIVTMPNADTLGSVYREQLEQLHSEIPEKVTLIENFGKANYFTAMHYAEVLIGNTSSGIIEAASFGKYVINVGSRQQGRAQGSNVFDVAFDSKKIVEKTHEVLKMPNFVDGNIYYKAATAEAIINTIKQHG